MWAVVVGYLCLAELVGILGWREQVMAFWRALIYTPPFLSLSSVKRWERWGAASSHSCELHLPGVRGSIVNSDLVPSTMPNYYQHHVIYTSVVEENITLQAVTGQSCAAAERGDLLNWPPKIHDERTFTVDSLNLLLSSWNVKCRLYLRYHYFVEFCTAEYFPVHKRGRPSSYHVFLPFFAPNSFGSS